MKLTIAAFVSAALSTVTQCEQSYYCCRGVCVAGRVLRVARCCALCAAGEARLAARRRRCRRGAGSGSSLAGGRGRLAARPPRHAAHTRVVCQCRVSDMHTPHEHTTTHERRTADATVSRPGADADGRRHKARNSAPLGLERSGGRGRPIGARGGLYCCRMPKKYSTSSGPSSGRSVQCTAFLTLLAPKRARTESGARCDAISGS